MPETCHSIACELVEHDGWAGVLHRVTPWTRCEPLKIVEVLSAAERSFSSGTLRLSSPGHSWTRSDRWRAGRSAHRSVKSWRSGELAELHGRVTTNDCCVVPLTSIAPCWSRTIGYPHELSRCAHSPDRHRTPCDAPPRGLQSPAQGDESGFTLIELVIVVAVLPIVLGGIATALLSVFSLQNQTQNRIGNSNDALVGSVTFNKDVQSAAQLTTVSLRHADQQGRIKHNCSDWNGVRTPPWRRASTTPWSPTCRRRHHRRRTPTHWCARVHLRTIRHAGVRHNDLSEYRHPGLTINPASAGTLASSGWTSAQGVTGITFNISEPEVVSGTNSPYAYSLVGLPGREHIHRLSLKRRAEARPRVATSQAPVPGPTPLRSASPTSAASRVPRAGPAPA